MNLTLSIPGTPPSRSTLAYWFGAPLREAAEPWQARIVERLRGESLPDGLSRLEATAELAFRDRRFRSPENFELVLRQALTDALAEVGWAGTVEAFTVRFTKRAEPATTITLRWGMAT